MKAKRWHPANWSIRAQLAISFVLVIVVSIGVSVWVVRWLAVTRLDEITLLTARKRAFRLAPFFADYYHRNGSWAGIQPWVDSFNRPLPTELTRGVVSYYPGRADLLEAANHDRLILVDAQGRVAADNEGKLAAGQPLPPKLSAVVVPVSAQETPVGSLVNISALDETAAIDVQIALQRSLLGAGLAAGVAAVLVSLTLAYSLTQPVRKLNTAAQRLASGQLSEPLPVESNNEIGRLTVSFNEMVEALNRQKKLRRQMAADIAHELRTPLSVMQLDLAGLADGLHTPVQAVASLQDELNALNRLVEDLRQLSLADAGAIRFELERIELKPFLQRIVDSWQTKAQSRQVNLISNIAPDLPAIHADTGRLAQVLNNLLGNALRYTPTGQSVTVGGRAGGGEVLLWVFDSGPGIAAEDLPYVFERFYRADRSRARETGGTGLGLAIAKQWVLLHGGYIWAESQPGHGAQFYISLPAT